MGIGCVIAFVGALGWSNAIDRMFGDERRSDIAAFQLIVSGLIAAGSLLGMVVALICAIVALFQRGVRKRRALLGLLINGVALLSIAGWIIYARLQRGNW